jgi:hypothetical protein
MKEIKYYLWFVPEIMFDPNKSDSIMGKIEIHSNEEEYSIKKINVFTPKKLEFQEWFMTIPKIVNSLEEIDEIENMLKLI